jgi:hypothetical protein
MMWNDDEQERARGMISDIGGKRAIDTLIKVSPPGYKHVNGYMLSLLSHLPDKEVMSYLTVLPVCVLRTLGLKQSSMAVQKALNMLDMVTDNIRENEICIAAEAIRYLGYAKAEDAVDRLVEISKSKFVELQYTANVALGRIGTSKAKERLLEQLKCKPVDCVKMKGDMSCWGMTGCVKGLALMYVKGHKDIAAEVNAVPWDTNQYGSATESLDEGKLLRDAVDAMRNLS